MRDRKSVVQGGLGLLVSGGLVLWMCFSLDWSEVGGHLVGMRYWIFAPATAVFVLHFVGRAWRWRFLLPAGGRVPLRSSFDSIMVGNFATYILPLRAGEFIRPYMLSMNTSYSFPAAFVSVVIERFFDLGAVLLSFAVMVLYVPGLPEWVHKGAAALGVLAAAIAVFIVAGSFFSERILALCRLFLRPLPLKLGAAVTKFLEEFLEGARVLRGARTLFAVVALTAVVWGLCYLMTYLLLLLSPDFAPSAWLAVSIGVIVALAVAAPSAPGFVGVYQVGCIAAFQLFGVSREAAVAYALVTHLYQYVLVVVFGMVGLMRNGLSLKDLSARPTSPLSGPQEAAPRGAGPNRIRT